MPKEYLNRDEEFENLDENYNTDFTYNKPYKQKKFTWTPQEDDEGYDYGFQIIKPEKEETAWEHYKRTGIWRGQTYYAQSLVDYGYVEKMANMFGAKFNITVVSGNKWSSDPKNKILTYEPTSLMQFPKARIIALLLHEIGHIKYTVLPEDKESPFITKYKNVAREVLNVFEDFRIDKIMARAYPGAEDVYEANKPVIKEMADNYERKSVEITNAIVNLTDHFSRPRVLTAEELMQVATRGAQAKSLEDEERDRIKKLKELQDILKKNENLMNYLAAILCTGYNNPVKMTPRIEQFVKKTIPAIKKCENAKTTAEVLKILDNEVYPVIEELMKDLFENIKEVEKLFGSAMAKQVAEQIKRFIQEGGMKLSEDKNYEHNEDPMNKKMRLPKQMRAGMGGLPKEWADGDYKSLRDSVDTPIKELIRKLTFLRKEEEAPRYLQNQKRGKLNVKSLYRHAIGDYRVFRRKLETQDTLRSYAFSLLLDKSGSMAGDRITHSTRSLIMLAEVFEKMKIPYEIATFGDGMNQIKRFSDKFTDPMKRKIGGVVTNAGGGTDLASVFRSGTDLEKQSERNRVMVIISDGDIGGGTASMHQTYMNKYKEQKNFKFIGVGLETGQEIINLCYGNGFVTDMPNKLPDLFSNMLKQIIFKKK